MNETINYISSQHELLFMILGTVIYFSFAYSIEVKSRKVSPWAFTKEKALSIYLVALVGVTFIVLDDESIGRLSEYNIIDIEEYPKLFYLSVPLTTGIIRRLYEKFVIKSKTIK